VKANAEDSYTVYFGSKAPAGQEGNWVQTWPGKSWFALLRLYSPLQPWFEEILGGNFKIRLNTWPLLC
jgi:hypothetical protein